MRRNYLATAYFSVLCLSISSTAMAVAQNYQIDKNHSFVQWQINHLGFSNQSGKWYVEGDLSLDEEKPQESKVSVTIPMTNLSTGHSELNQHLSGELFFNVKQFPSATFVSDKITLVGKNEAKISGILTVKGISKSVVLDAKLNKKGVNILNDKMTVGFSATTRVKRSDFGMTALLPNLGDDVDLMIEVEAFAQQSDNGQ